jgi:enediyne biosynthesis protein E4
VWLAVVSQPSNRGAKVKAPGKIDKTLGEFWSENPWDIILEGHNLSAFERKRLYLNVPAAGGGTPDGGTRDFVDVSYLSGADNDGDGRGVVAADLRNNGRLDLLVRQSGGGSFYVYENDFPQRHYLEVSLRGTKSNRFGIGARLVATVKGQKLVREQFPQNTFRSQAPNIVHFGLAGATQVDRLVIRWPSGTVQELSNLPADRHIIVEEGKQGTAAVETVTPGQTMRP